jgi:hypothetical protein
MKLKKTSEPRLGTAALSFGRFEQISPDRLIGTPQPAKPYLGWQREHPLFSYKHGQRAFHQLQKRKKEMKMPISTNNLIDVFVGVDIGKGFHCATAINGRGDVLLKAVKVLVSAEGFAVFEQRLNQLGDKNGVLIGLEASGHYWMSLWRFLQERDWTVQVINPVLSSKSARTHLRGRKTDADDALFIARTVRDDFIPLQPAQQATQQLKLLCRQRRFIIHELANAKRRLTGLIDLSFQEFSRHFKKYPQPSGSGGAQSRSQCRYDRSVVSAPAPGPDSACQSRPIRCSQSQGT